MGTSDVGVVFIAERAGWFAELASSGVTPPCSLVHQTKQPGRCFRRYICAKEIEMAVIKLNYFIIRCTNHDEILELVKFVRNDGFESVPLGTCTLETATRGA